MYEEQLLLKQVAVHGVDSPECWVKDMEYIYFGMGYRYGFFDKGIGNRRKAIENGKWYSADTKYYNVPSRLVNIAYAYKDLSILMIAHRLDSIKSCDCIYYLENGKIVEFGSEAELMELHGKYFALKSVTKSSENTIDKQFK